MRDTLGYDEVFDELFYSCDEGVAKPDPAFFTGAVERLGTRRSGPCSSTTTPTMWRARGQAGLVAEVFAGDGGRTELERILALYDGVGEKVKPLAYPKELTYPCCRQALGGLGEVSPREGPVEKSTRWRPGDDFRSTGLVSIRRIANRSPCMTTTTSTRAVDLSIPAHRVFLHLLVNTLLVSVINFTVWFAITFWVYLETRSVLATGMVAGIFLVATALSGIWFGSLVDHHRKKSVMQVLDAGVARRCTWGRSCSTRLTPKEVFTDPASVRLWIFIVICDGRRDRRQHPLHRPDDPGHRADRGGPPGQGQRPGRHGHRGVVPGHLGDQRSCWSRPATCSTCCCWPWRC